MKKGAPRRTRLSFSIIGMVFLALIILAYPSAHNPVDLEFDFLGDCERRYHNTHDTSWGRQTVTVHCLPAYHDSICHVAGKELLALGYKEVSPPIQYGSSDYRFDPAYRRIATEFRKEGRTSISVCINKGRFLEARPDGNLSFTGELDWVNVVIRQTRLEFSLWQELRYWCNRLLRRKPSPRMVPFISATGS